MKIYCVKGVAAYHELRAVCATVPSGTVAHTARMHTRIHDMLPHPSQIYVRVLQIVLPVILARNMSASWGWHVICRNM
jgi:hypothetical protein